MSLWISIKMDGEDHGNVPVFKREGTGEWVFSDGAYSTYEFFAGTYGYPEDEDSMPIGMDEFQEKLFAHCDTLADGIQASFVVFNHLFTLNQVYCDNYGNEL